MNKLNVIDGPEISNGKIASNGSKNVKKSDESRFGGFPDEALD